MMKSCAWFTRILTQAPERSPGSYLLSRRFATSPSSPCSFTERIKFGRLASRMGEYRIGSANVGRTCFSISARRLTNGSAINVTTAEDQQVEYEEMQRLAGATILESIEGRPALAIQ